MAGHGKGSEFERKICKALSLWWTDGERDDVFWRTSTSGARAKTRSKTKQGTFGQYGDIQATDPVGQPLIDMFTFELKIGYKGASVADILDKGPKSAKQHWEKWIEQVIQDHENAGSISWALITKRDRREPLIFIPQKTIIELIHRGFKPAKALPRFIIITKSHEKISAYPLKNFIEATKPEMIIKIAKKGKE